MATVITKELNITVDNSPTYCTADNTTEYIATTFVRRIHAISNEEAA